MKNIFKKRKLLVFSILILVGLFLYSSASAAGLPWFGGRITTVIPCTCSIGSQVNIIGYPAIFSGSYLYSPTTQIRGKGNVIPSRFILGLYSPGGVCMVGVAPDCSTLPITKGTMSIIGTN